MTELEVPGLNAARPCKDDKSRLNPLQEEEEGGGSPPSSPEHPGGVDSDDYSTAGESGEGRRHRIRWWAERRLATGKIELAHISFYRCKCRRDL